MRNFSVFDELYQEGLNESLFKDLAPRHLFFTFSTVNGWMLWARDENIQVDEPKIELLLTMLWDAVKP
ncbi:hypothetical protein MM239_07990 [Belliella sp. DSM 111904]|uniref:Transcriptional regulator TetR C-terminal Firmicutes type domain-containing protein n=1 Tax=Belliella filtrata TaxID=2923435 RepID=A0ABS9UZD3_9BACT|nr:hypothetical protein [Belliella filtrata]MCH7409329.1 hypothetical protein [Belliella filtrata]